MFASLPLGVYVLAVAQALNLTAAVMSVTISALVGGLLASNQAWGTVPYGMQFLAVMLFTYPASWLMKRIGRKKVFLGGSLFLFFAGVVGFQAVNQKSFVLLVLSCFLLGGYIACANFYRFAAVDSLEGKAKARGMSWVVSGGVLAAFLGPALASYLRPFPGYEEFAMCYLGFSGIAVATCALLLFWKPTDTAPPTASQGGGDPPVPASRVDLFFAIAVASWGYLSMNLLMVLASLVMKDLCSFNQSSNAIQAHVLAMFVPSFFVGHLVARYGALAVICLGFALLIASCLVGLFYFEYWSIYVALLLLGVAWNFLYVSGGVLLSSNLNADNRYTWQGLNDTLIALCATLGAFLPAPMLSFLGWNATNEVVIGVSAVFMCAFVLIVFKRSRASVARVGAS